MPPIPSCASENGFIAYNTDFQAFRDSLTANLPGAIEGVPATLHSRTALILGAGGVARSAAQALCARGASVMIANRNYERGLQLAEEVGCRAIDWAARHNVICDTLINCTSVGMHPNIDESPIHPSFLKPGLTVMDLVYTPETTLLVKEARSRGCHVLTGVDMFVRQAALQFELFTGRAAPLELMRQVVQTRPLAGGLTGPKRGMMDESPSECAMAPANEAIHNLFLIGYRCTGKTTVARILAERIGWKWVDADKAFEERYGRSIRLIFAEEGEAGFREKEAAVLEQLCGCRNQVVATGGGVVLAAANRDRLRAAGRVIWLTADAQTLWRRLQVDTTTPERRPPLAGGGLVEIQQLLEMRRPLYQACADLSVDTTDVSAEVVARRILDFLRSNDFGRAGGVSVRPERGALAPDDCAIRALTRPRRQRDMWTHFMLVFLLLNLFVLGTIVGSLLNVCIHRLPLEKSIMWPGSHCGQCLQAIRWYDNIPLLSYLILRGRCRDCGQRYSARYFLIELLTGLCFAGLFYLEVICDVHGLDPNKIQATRVEWRLSMPTWPAWIVFGYHALLLCFLIVASFCDLDYREIPLSITIPGTVIGLIGAMLLPWPWPLSLYERRAFHDDGTSDPGNATRSRMVGGEPEPQPHTAGSVSLAVLGPVAGRICTGR